MYRALPLPLALVALLGAASLVPPLAAQKPAQEPRRPKLAADADTNDPDAYYAYGQLRDVPWKKAFDAFHWAYRLDPKQTTSLYMKWQAMWGRQDPGWREEYRNGAEFVVKSKEAKQLDSLYYEAMLRDPLPNFVSNCYMPDWVTDVRDPVLAGYVYFDGRCFRQAAAKWGEALTKRPKLLTLRRDRAVALYYAGSYDSAAAEVRTVLDTLRARDQKRLVHVYNSKEMLEHMLGAIYARAGRRDEARAAYGRALAENLAFWPAHARLALLALEEGDVLTAAGELETAVQVKGDDGVLRHDYGVALLAAGRHADAEAQFRKAVELEPHFSLNYFNLAAALEAQGKTREAIEQYRAFLARAPRARAKLIDRAVARIDALGRTS